MIKNKHNWHLNQIHGHNKCTLQDDKILKILANGCELFVEQKPILNQFILQNAEFILNNISLVTQLLVEIRDEKSDQKTLHFT